MEGVPKRTEGITSYKRRPIRGNCKWLLNLNTKENNFFSANLSACTFFEVLQIEFLR